MNIKLTMGERLKDERVMRDLTLEQLSDRTGISRSALARYETDEPGDISPYNLSILSEFYDVSMEYLMGLTEQKNPPLTEIESLHINDQMIGLLKEGRINNRLLCELATHESFPLLMADIEIYIDRIASMRIRDLNAMLESARKEVIEKFHPDNNDGTLRFLETGQIDEGKYFADIIHDDLDTILKDLREHHRSDALTADEYTVIDKFNKTLKEMKGSPDKGLALLIHWFYSALGIREGSLTDDEKASFESILKKSKLLQTGFASRGRYKKRHKR